jgi:hypothetical protein
MAAPYAELFRVLTPSRLSSQEIRSLRGMLLQPNGLTPSAPPV